MQSRCPPGLVDSSPHGRKGPWLIAIPARKAYLYLYLSDILMWLVTGKLLDRLTELCEILKSFFGINPELGY